MTSRQRHKLFTFLHHDLYTGNFKYFITVSVEKIELCFKIKTIFIDLNIGKWKTISMSS